MNKNNNSDMISSRRRTSLLQAIQNQSLLFKIKSSVGRITGVNKQTGKIQKYGIISQIIVPADSNLSETVSSSNSRNNSNSSKTKYENFSSISSVIEKVFNRRKSSKITPDGSESRTQMEVLNLLCSPLVIPFISNEAGKAVPVKKQKTFSDSYESSVSKQQIRGVFDLREKFG